MFPPVGAIVILGTLAAVSAADLSGSALDAYRTQETGAIVRAYGGLAVALALVALVVWQFRDRLKGENHSASSGLVGFDLLKRPRFGYGAACIFLYVGAEVSIGSLIVSYLTQSHVLGNRAAGRRQARRPLLGRGDGRPFHRLRGAQGGEPGQGAGRCRRRRIALILVSANTTGAASGYSLLAIGLMNSIMFPTIFTLACEKLGARAADGSGIINVAICGGAVVPLLTGMIADSSGSLAVALGLPAVCYAVIAGFGVFARKPA